MRRHAFTLLELVLAMIIISIIAAVVVPVTVSAADAYADARDLRQRAEAAAFAIDSVTRTLREAPRGASTRLDASTATATALVFGDGSGIQLDGDTLELVHEGVAHPLARDVTAFEIVYLDADGRTTAAQPADAHRLHITLTSGGVTLTTVVFPRVNAGGDA